VAKGLQKQKALDGIHDLAIDSHNLTELFTIDVIMGRKPRRPEMTSNRKSEKSTGAVVQRSA
jgi:hypothetical protein